MTRHRATGLSSARRLLCAIALVGLSAVASAQAQAPPQESAAAPVLNLTPAQRLTIYQSITQTQKNSAAPVGFRVTIGARVPDSIEIKPLSDTLAKLVPQAKELGIAMIEKEVVLVDPASRQVIAVVTQEPANAVQ
jgi:hypothetical protein